MYEHFLRFFITLAVIKTKKYLVFVYNFEHPKYNNKQLNKYLNVEKNIYIYVYILYVNNYI